jgi:hypothetical protein
MAYYSPEKGREGTVGAEASEKVNSQIRNAHFLLSSMANQGVADRLFEDFDEQFKSNKTGISFGTSSADEMGSQVYVVSVASSSNTKVKPGDLVLGVGNNAIYDADNALKVQALIKASSVPIDIKFRRRVPSSSDPSPDVPQDEENVPLDRGQLNTHFLVLELSPSSPDINKKTEDNLTLSPQTPLKLRQLDNSLESQAHSVQPRKSSFRWSAIKVKRSSTREECSCEEHQTGTNWSKSLKSQLVKHATSCFTGGSSPTKGRNSPNFGRTGIQPPNRSTPRAPPGSGSAATAVSPADNNLSGAEKSMDAMDVYQSTDDPMEVTV